MPFDLEAWARREHEGDRLTRLEAESEKLRAALEEKRWGCTLCNRLGGRWPQRCGAYPGCGHWYIDVDALEAQT